VVRVEKAVVDALDEVRPDSRTETRSSVKEGDATSEEEETGNWHCEMVVVPSVASAGVAL